MKLSRMLLLIIGIMLVSASVVSAQKNDKSKAITIEPFLQEVILEPADPSKTFSVTVTNNTSSIFRFNVTPVDFGTLNETGGIFFTGSEALELGQKYGLANWIEIDKTVTELAPSQKTKINITLLNRNDLAPGGHYGAIFINSERAGASGNNPSIAFRQSISSLVLAIKRGGEKYDLALSSINTNGSWFKPPTNVTLRFKNTGNTHVVPRGVVNVSGGKGQIYSKGVINQDSSYILPESFRVIPVDLKSQKSYPFRLIGTQEVKVDYRYDGLDKFATKSYSVRWVNWPLLTALILGIIASSYLIFKKYGAKMNFKGLFR